LPGATLKRGKETLLEGISFTLSGDVGHFEDSLGTTFNVKRGEILELVPDSGEPLEIVLKPDFAWSTESGGRREFQLADSCKS